jgi:hypothetical protein
MRSEKNARLTIWVPKPMYNEIQAHAKKEECPLSFIARKALKHYLENYDRIRIEEIKNKE